MMKYLIFSILFIVSCSGSTDNNSAVEKSIPTNNTTSEVQKSDKESIAYKLAVLEKDGYVSEDDSVIEKFDEILNLLDNKYVESKIEIADKTVTVKEILNNEYAVKESLLNIMEGMYILNDPNDSDKNYSEYSSMYIIIRIEGLSHEETIQQMQVSINDIGFDGLLIEAGLK